MKLKSVNLHSRARSFFCCTGSIIGISIAGLILVFFIIQTNPSIGALGADFLRSIIGDRAVASIEMDVNQAADFLQRLRFQLGLETPASPWTALPATPLMPPPSNNLTATSTSVVNQPSLTNQSTHPSTTPNPFEPSSTPTQMIWPPVAIAPAGTAAGEGIWTAYIQDVQGNTVAYRTFYQPDPSRPYSLVAIVAIDLTHTRLHFVLGTVEPAGENHTARSGAIPTPDQAPNVLLAAFNGGFKARHGEFGAMADGITAIPPREGLGTVATYENGKVELGEWGTEITLTPDTTAFRQNGPLVIQHGQINPRIYNNSPQDWGYTVNDVSPTVRSGIGLSEDEKTLYYFCGPSLSMEALAKAMQAAGVWNAIQLDINNYWTLFVRFIPTGTKLVPEALLPKLMVSNVGRYLWNYSRDYFYITDDVK